MVARAFSVSGLRAGYGDTVVLDGLSLHAEEGALTVLAGPVGSGKSTLLAVVSGTSRGWCEWEVGLLGGAALGGRNLVPVLGQMAVKLPPKPRVEAIREFLAGPGALLCIDEPTAGIYGDYADAVLEVIAEAARKRAVLLVTHNLVSVRDIADSVAILASGRVVEQTPGREFFTKPASSAGRAMLETGSHSEPSANANGFALSPEFRPFPPSIDLAPRSKPSAPVDWILPEQIGIVVNRSMRDLAKAGVTRVIALDGTTDGDESGIRVAPVRWDPLSADHLAQMELLCHLCASGVARGERIALRAPPHSAAALVAAAALLVTKRVTALDAVAAVTYRSRGKPMTLEEEQIVWDFELRLDMMNASHTKAAQ